MSFIHWHSKDQNPHLMLVRVNRRELTPQDRSPPEGGARERVRTTGTTAGRWHNGTRRSRGKTWQGHDLTYIPKQSQAGLSQHPGPQWCVSKAKAVLATRPLLISLPQKWLLSLTEQSSTVDNCKHHTYAFLCLIILFTVGLKILASKTISYYLQSSI